ncbi:hypothetical protein Halhy_5263 [Haliscomenobacter hydrossis DSM 1100]|uniref:Uncharacterized protein n=1 Tax=Haliscomenobacter hydrossis (strain ATCC 27775 / DSM 1100 / LMG 10767 / O) TaxID=760192 RepID=F4L628_HALH1|nr:hypothetical protein Halhy_5263 [Haliscomenobacter hydrossis DSM 1100]
MVDIRLGFLWLGFVRATQFFEIEGFEVIRKLNEKQSLYKRAKIYAALFKCVIV